MWLVRYLNKSFTDEQEEIVFFFRSLLSNVHVLHWWSIMILPLAQCILLVISKSFPLKNIYININTLKNISHGLVGRSDVHHWLFETGVLKVLVTVFGLQMGIEPQVKLWVCFDPSPMNILHLKFICFGASQWGWDELWGRRTLNPLSQFPSVAAVLSSVIKLTWKWSR